MSETLLIVGFGQLGQLVSRQWTRSPIVAVTKTTRDHETLQDFCTDSLHLLIIQNMFAMQEAHT